MFYWTSKFETPFMYCCKNHVQIKETTDNNHKIYQKHKWMCDIEQIIYESINYYKKTNYMTKEKQKFLLGVKPLILLIYGKNKRRNNNFWDLWIDHCVEEVCTPINLTERYISTFKYF